MKETLRGYPAESASYFNQTGESSNQYTSQHNGGVTPCGSLRTQRSRRFEADREPAALRGDSPLVSTALEDLLKESKEAARERQREADAKQQEAEEASRAAQSIVEALRLAQKYQERQRGGQYYYGRAMERLSSENQPQPDQSRPNTPTMDESNGKYPSSEQFAPENYRAELRSTNPFANFTTTREGYWADSDFKPHKTGPQPNVIPRAGGQRLSDLLPRVSAARNPLPLSPLALNRYPYGAVRDLHSQENEYRDPDPTSYTSEQPSRQFGVPNLRHSQSISALQQPQPPFARHISHDDFRARDDTFVLGIQKVELPMLKSHELDLLRRMAHYEAKKIAAQAVVSGTAVVQPLISPPPSVSVHPASPVPSQAQTILTQQVALRSFSRSRSQSRAASRPGSPEGQIIAQFQPSCSVHDGSFRTPYDTDLALGRARAASAPQTAYAPSAVPTEPSRGCKSEQSESKGCLDRLITRSSGSKSPTGSRSQSGSAARSSGAKLSDSQYRGDSMVLLDAWRLFSSTPNANDTEILGGAVHRAIPGLKTPPDATTNIGAWLEMEKEKHLKDIDRERRKKEREKKLEDEKALEKKNQLERQLSILKHEEREKKKMESNRRRKVLKDSIVRTLSWPYRELRRLRLCSSSGESSICSLQIGEPEVDSTTRQEILQSRGNILLLGGSGNHSGIRNTATSAHISSDPQSTARDSVQITTSIGSVFGNQSSARLSPHPSRVQKQQAKLLLSRPQAQSSWSASRIGQRAPRPGGALRPPGSAGPLVGSGPYSNNSAPPFVEELNGFPAIGLQHGAPFAPRYQGQSGAQKHRSDFELKGSSDLLVGTALSRPWDQQAHNDAAVGSSSLLKPHGRGGFGDGAVQNEDGRRDWHGDEDSNASQRHRDKALHRLAYEPEEEKDARFRRIWEKYGDNYSKIPDIPDSPVLKAKETSRYTRLSDLFLKSAAKKKKTLQ